MQLDTTEYRLVSQTDVLAAQGALTEGFTTVEPARMVVAEGYRGCRIIPLGAPSGGTTTADVYIVDRVEGEHAPGSQDQGWIITKIGVSSTITFSGAVATSGRSPNLLLPSTFATFTEDASFTQRRVYGTLTAGFGVPVVNVAPIFEIFIPELANAYAVIVQFQTTFGGTPLTNANAYIALDR